MATLSEYYTLRKEAFENLRQAAPERPITHAMLLEEIARLVRGQAT